MARMGHRSSLRAQMKGDNVSERHTSSKPLKFCLTHHWQTIDAAGRCAWCTRIAAGAISSTMKVAPFGERFRDACH